MDTLTNPAGRLYTLLDRYRKEAHPEADIVQTWGRVLEVAGYNQTLQALCNVASLIPQIDMAIAVAGDNTYQRQIFNHCLPCWAEPIFFPMQHGRETPSPGTELIDDQALSSLGGISSYLDLAVPHAEMPSPQELHDLHKQLAEIISSVSEAADIPTDLKIVIVDHLNAVGHALVNIRIGGPEGVLAATERLAGWFGINSGIPELERHHIMSKVMTMLRKAWTIFKAGSVVLKGITAWENVDKLMLPPGH